MTSVASHAPPAVDEGNPPSGLALLRRLLAPTPGRFGNTLRLVVLVLASVTISEVFRMPEAAVSAYIVLFVSKGEAASTIAGAAIAGMAILVALLITIVVFMVSLAEPALRIPLVALTTFVAMFLSRTSPLGPVFFAAGFIIAYGLTLGDEVFQLSLAPQFASNTASALAVPELAFIPPEEALLRFVLWLAAVVGMPICLVIAANLAAGRDPGLIWRASLAERFTAAADFCMGAAGAELALATLARQGTAGLAKLAHLAGVLHRDPRRAANAAVLTREAGRLGLVLLAWARLPDAAGQQTYLAPFGQTCRDAARAVRDGGPPPALPALQAGTTPIGAARPLAVELRHILQAIAATLGGVPPITTTAHPAAPKAAPKAAPEAAGAARHLLAPDAFTNPAYARFAFNVTLAVMLCYIGESLANWPGIHTCIITCFFVSLDTVGETVHKSTLRITGCLIGGALGIATILLLMPAMTDLGDLLLVIGAVTWLSAWVATGSERISYAGWQIAIAFYLAVLQGYGPTLDMETARDRIAGILIGDVVVFVIFTTIWPVSVATAVRRDLAAALDQLAGLMNPAALQTPGPHGTAASAADAGAGFAQSIEQASELMVNDPYEPLHVRNPAAPGAITAGVLERVQALMVPVSVILTLGEDQAWNSVEGPARAAVLDYHRTMSEWLRRAADWVRTGTGAGDVIAALPKPPGASTLVTGSPEARTHGAERAAWYTVLHQDIRAILQDVAPPSFAERPSQPYEAEFAPS